MISKKSIDPEKYLRLTLTFIYWLFEFVLEMFREWDQNYRIIIIIIFSMFYVIILFYPLVPKE